MTTGAVTNGAVRLSGAEPTAVPILRDGRTIGVVLVDASGARWQPIRETGW